MRKEIQLVNPYRVIAEINFLEAGVVGNHQGEGEAKGILQVTTAEVHRPNRSIFFDALQEVNSILRAEAIVLEHDRGEGPALEDHFSDTFHGLFIFESIRRQVQVGQGESSSHNGNPGSNGNNNKYKIIKMSNGD